MIADPLPDAGERILADWLELSSIFSLERSCSLDALVNAFDIQVDYEREDIGEADALEEDLRSRLSAEIENRAFALGAEYPFRMSRNGETLAFYGVGTEGQAAYIICLLASNSWTNRGLLIEAGKLSGTELHALRGIFEVVAALAAAGYCQGPSFLIGTNRRGAAALIERVQAICDHVGEGRARDKPEPDAPLNANDDKVDVIAIRTELDGAPHSGFYFCQSASGANYHEKSMQNEVENFLHNWFDVRPARTDALVVMPDVLHPHKLSMETRRLGHILHRLRAPHYAALGAAMAAAEAIYVDSWPRRFELYTFLEGYGGRTGTKIMLQQTAE